MNVNDDGTIRLMLGFSRDSGYKLPDLDGLLTDSQIQLLHELGNYRLSGDVIYVHAHNLSVELNSTESAIAKDIKHLHDIRLICFISTVPPYHTKLRINYGMPDGTGAIEISSMLYLELMAKRAELELDSDVE
jgi:biotin operon repressor